MKHKSKILDVIFWVLLLLFTNPGGIQNALGIFELFGNINLNDFLIIPLTGCYVLVINKKTRFDTAYKNINKSLLIFFCYYFLVFGYLTPNYFGTENYSFRFTIVKLRYSLYSYLLFNYTYVFFKRSYGLFLKIYFYTSLVILVVFLQSVFTGIEILPVLRISRRFIDIDRIFMANYGFLGLMIPLGIIYTLFKLKTANRQLILVNMILVIVVLFLALTRRHILSILFYLIIAYFLNIYIKRGSIKRRIIIGSRIAAIVLIILFLLSFILPTYYYAGKKALVNTFEQINYSLNNDEEVDARLQLNRPFILNIFLENPILGSGFDNRWRTIEGDKEGFEASDYPLLSALAMTGILGIIIFLPIYLYLVKYLYCDLRLLRKYKVLQHHIVYGFYICMISWLIFEFLQYMNYFHPISLSHNYVWYCYLSFYLASRHNFYQNSYILNRLNE